MGAESELRGDFTEGAPRDVHFEDALLSLTVFTLFLDAAGPVPAFERPPHLHHRVSAGVGRFMPRSLLG